MGTDFGVNRALGANWGKFEGARVATREEINKQAVVLSDDNTVDITDHSGHADTQDLLKASTSAHNGEVFFRTGANQYVRVNLNQGNNAEMLRNLINHAEQTGKVRMTMVNFPFASDQTARLGTTPEIAFNEQGFRDHRLNAVRSEFQIEQKLGAFEARNLAEGQFLTADQMMGLTLEAIFAKTGGQTLSCKPGETHTGKGDGWVPPASGGDPTNGRIFHLLNESFPPVFPGGQHARSMTISRTGTGFSVTYYGDGAKALGSRNLTLPAATPVADNTSRANSVQAVKNHPAISGTLGQIFPNQAFNADSRRNADLHFANQQASVDNFNLNTTNLAASFTPSRSLYDGGRVVSTTDRNDFQSRYITGGMHVVDRAVQAARRSGVSDANQLAQVATQALLTWNGTVTLPAPAGSTTAPPPYQLFSARTNPGMTLEDEAILESYFEQQNIRVNLNVANPTDITTTTIQR